MSLSGGRVPNRGCSAVENLVTELSSGGQLRNSQTETKT